MKFALEAWLAARNSTKDGRYACNRCRHQSSALVPLMLFDRELGLTPENQRELERLLAERDQCRDAQGRFMRSSSPWANTKRYTNKHQEAA